MGCGGIRFKCTNRGRGRVAGVWWWGWAGDGLPGRGGEICHLHPIRVPIRVPIKSPPNPPNGGKMGKNGGKSNTIDRGKGVNRIAYVGSIVYILYNFFFLYRVSYCPNGKGD